MFGFLKKKKTEVVKKEEVKVTTVAPAEMSEKERIKKERREKRIAEVMEKTGWSHDEAEAKMKAAKAACGITYADYSKNDFHEVLIDKQKEAYAAILAKKEINKRARENRINSVMEKTGWDYDFTAKAIADTRKLTGCSYKEYVAYELYNIPVEEQQQYYKECLEKKENELLGKYEKTVAATMEITGWDYEFASEKVRDARERTGCTPKEYLMYRFYNLTDEEQETFYLARYQKFFEKKYDVNKEFSDMLYDKERTNLYFSEYVRRPWCVNTKVSEEEFKKVFANTKRIIYKPNAGHRGYGIEAFNLTEENLSEVYNTLAGYPIGVVEEFIVQHPAMASLSPSSVNSLRFVTFSSNTKPVTKDGKMVDVAYSMVRIGRGESIVDNLHSGGMVANANLETGKLETLGADRNGKMYEVHPETGVKIRDFEIPFFNEARDMVLEAIEKKKVEGYLGWDIAISEEGPKLLEVNVRPGSDGLQTAYAHEKKGQKYKMIKYL